VSLTLVIGGTRSGKSAYAERLAEEIAGPVTYVATADSDDASMAHRIRRHVERRPASWTTVHAGDALGSAAEAADCLIDGLGVWIAGVLHRHDGAAGDVVVGEIERVIEIARSREVIVVAEEAGQGVLPPDDLSRRWLDLLGAATQRLGRAAARVDYVVAGRAMTIAGSPAATVPAGLRRHGDQDGRPGDGDHAVDVLQPGPPGWLVAALGDGLGEAVRRSPDARGAMVALSARHGRDPAEIVPTNGAVEALWLLGPALRPRLAACVYPGSTETEAGLRAHGVPIARVARNPEDGFRLDPRAVPAEADLVIVGNPVSPSGTLDPAHALRALRAPGRTVVVDEALMSMVPDEPGSLAGERLEDVIVVRSLTELLSVPGLRVGYVLAPPRLADALRAVRPPWAANALALATLTAAAEHPAELRLLAERAAADSADLQARLRPIGGLRTWPSATPFSLIEVADGPRVVAALRGASIAVRPAASFPGLDEGHIRITARDPERNAALARALAEALR